MNRAQRRAQRLPPLPQPWEAIFLDRPVTRDDGRVEADFLILCESGGALRAAGRARPRNHGQGVVDLAIRTPVEGKPGRPRKIVCADEGTVAMLRELEVMGELVVGPVPAATRYADAATLRERAARVPRVQGDPEAWREALTELCRAAPWRVWPPGVRLPLRGEPVLEAGALRVDTTKDLVLVHFTPSGANPLNDRREPAWFLMLTDAGRWGRTLEEVAGRGWAMPGGLVPEVRRGLADGDQDLDAAEQRRFLAAIQALAALAAEPGATRLRVGTAVGWLEIEGPEARLPVEIQPGDARVEVSTDHDRPRVVIRLPKDERSLAIWKSLTEVRLSWLEGRWELAGRARGVDVGLLATTPERVRGEAVRVGLADPAEGEPWFEAELPLVRAAPPPPRPDPVFRGPAADWPAPEEVLLAFLREGLPRSLDELDQPSYAGAIEVGAAVFSAVSRADHGGEEGALERVQQLFAGWSPESAVVERLIRAKRRRFGSDPRILVVERIGAPGRPRSVVVGQVLPARVELE